MGKEQKYIAAARCGFNLPKHGKSMHFRRNFYYDKNTIYLSWQYVSGIVESKENQWFIDKSNGGLHPFCTF